jgi:hypothetical protein
LTIAPAASGFLQLQSVLEPVFGIPQAVGIDFGRRQAGDFAHLRSFEIEQNLPGQGLHSVPGKLHRDALTVRRDAQLAERLLDIAEFAAERLQSAPDLLGLDTILAQLDQGLDGDEVGKGVVLGGRNQILTLPTLQLPLGDAELAPYVRSRQLLFRDLRGHGTILAGASVPHSSPYCALLCLPTPPSAF